MDGKSHGPRILFVSSGPLQAQLAGPAIRCLELARQVNRVAAVTITAQYRIERATPGLAQQPFQAEADLLALIAAHDAVVVQGLLTLHFPKVLLADRVKIFDLYDPLNLETLEHGQVVSEEQRWHEYHYAQTVLRGQLSAGDFFLCANERQRDYYLGMLAAVGRMNPLTYAEADRDLRQLLAVVPVGLSPDRPAHTRSVLRGVHPAIAPDDFVLLWGGSLLDWLDPLTLIRAMAQVQTMRPDVKLFFLASRNPLVVDPHSIVARAQALSRELGLLDRTVIFNRDWVPYEERANYLLEADAGVTTHLDHLETRFSFRTRVLDYLWAGLPMLSSAGDTFSELMQREGLGLTAPPGDVDALAQAIVQLAGDAAARRQYASNVRRVAETFRWETVAQPLVEFCRAPRVARDRQRAPTVEPAQADRTLAGPPPLAVTQLQTEIRRKRRSTFASISAQLKTLINRHVLRRRYTQVFFERLTEAEGVLLPGQRRGQTFQAYAPNLCGVQIFFGTSARVNTCEIVLHLCDSPQATTDLATVRVNAMWLLDCRLHLFPFVPIADSAGRQFYVWLEAPDAVLSDGVTLFHYVENGELVLAQHYA